MDPDDAWRICKIEFNIFEKSGSIDFTTHQNKIIKYHYKFLADVILYCLYDRCNFDDFQGSFNCTLEFSFRTKKYRISKNGRNNKTTKAYLATWTNDRWINENVVPSTILLMMTIPLGDFHVFASRSIFVTEQLYESKDQYDFLFGAFGFNKSAQIDNIDIGAEIEAEFKKNSQFSSGTNGLRNNPISAPTLREALVGFQKKYNNDFSSNSFNKGKFTAETSINILPNQFKEVTLEQDTICMPKISKIKIGSDDQPKTQAEYNKTLMEKMPMIISKANKFLASFSDYKLECYFVAPGKTKEKKFDPNMSTADSEVQRRIEITMRRPPLHIEFDLDLLDNCERIIADIALAIGFKQMLAHYASNVLIMQSDFGYDEVDNIDRVKMAIRCAKKKYENIIIISESDDVKDLIEYH
jgi:hypothetical protein